MGFNRKDGIYYRNKDKIKAYQQPEVFPKFIYKLKKGTRVHIKIIVVGWTGLI